MDVREKLVELLKQTNTELQKQPGAKVWGDFADHLIAHGVTVQDNTEISDELLEQLRNAPVTILQEEPTIEVVQEWISVRDRLPNEDGNYLVFQQHTYGTAITTVRFAKDARKVDKYDFVRGWKNVWFKYDSEYGHYTLDDVTHWMPLPEPPKGE